MTWFIWALLSSFCVAALAESNRILKLNAQMLNAWRSTFAVLLMSMALPSMIFPADYKNFYLVAGIDGIVTAIGMVMFFYMAARRTGRVSSMILPVAAFGAYMMWWMMKPELRPTLDDSPFQVLLAFVSVTLICVAFQKIRDNDASWESFLMILPVGLSFGVIDAITKNILSDKYDAYPYILSYTFLSLVACMVAAWVAAIPPPLGGRPTGFWNGKLLWGGFWCGFWTAGMMLTGVLALTAAPNPSLPGLVLALTPIWLFALNSLRKVKDDVSIPASILILAGAAGLMISSL